MPSISKSVDDRLYPKFFRVERLLNFGRAAITMAIGILGKFETLKKTSPAIFDGTGVFLILLIHAFDKGRMSVKNIGIVTHEISEFRNLLVFGINLITFWNVGHESFQSRNDPVLVLLLPISIGTLIVAVWFGALRNKNILFAS